MKFEQFQATRQWVDDVKIDADKHPGFVYDGGLHIEAPKPDGPFTLYWFEDSHTGPLEEMYDLAVAEGYITGT